MVHKVIIVSVRVLYISLYWYTCLENVFKWVCGWVVHKVIIVSVRVLYVRFLGFWVFRFSGFWVFRFFGRDARFFGWDGTGRDTELDNFHGPIHVYIQLHTYIFNINLIFSVHLYS